MTTVGRRGLWHQSGGRDPPRLVLSSCLTAKIKAAAVRRGAFVHLAFLGRTGPVDRQEPILAIPGRWWGEGPASVSPSGGRSRGSSLPFARCESARDDHGKSSKHVGKPKAHAPQSGRRRWRHRKTPPRRCHNAVLQRVAHRTRVSRDAGVCYRGSSLDRANDHFEGDRAVGVPRLCSSKPLLGRVDAGSVGCGRLIHGCDRAS